MNRWPSWKRRPRRFPDEAAIDTRRGRRVYVCTVLSAGLLALIALPIHATSPNTAEGAFTFVPADRVLILAPHPDDEILACGGVLQRALGHGAAVQACFLTYGDNNEWSFTLYRHRPVLTPGGMRRMGLVRHDEALDAARTLGLATNDLVFLGYPDFRMLPIWLGRWNGAPPEEGMFTRVTAVPYANALRPGAAYTGEEVLRDIEAVVRAFRPTHVFLPHPADLNPDHRALYLFAKVALWNAAPQAPPRVHAYLVHAAGWPRPEKLHPGLPLDPPPGIATSLDWERVPLTPRESARKTEALRAHRTQFGYSGAYMLAFARANELFAADPVVLLSARAPAAELPAGNETVPEAGAYSEEERVAIVGLERQSVAWSDERLVVRLDLVRPLGRELELSLYAFGWRPDRPFADMPKLHVRVSPLGHAVHDLGRRLPPDTVRVRREARQVEIDIPAGALGGPRRVLTGVRCYLADLPVDHAGWSALELGGEP